MVAVTEAVMDMRAIPQADNTNVDGVEMWNINGQCSFGITRFYLNFLILLFLTKR